MPTSLIIVESPAKTKTLRSFLGPNFRVEASMGHVRDLPAKRLGVDVAREFATQYVVIPDRKDAVKKLKDAVAKADRIYLASDPDREGEAIAHHLAEALGIANALRIEFNEITRTAVLSALAAPRSIDTKRVDAQEARRILDRLVGYKLSPLLWTSVRSRLSAGRVQSVVLRLICDRERAIQAFVPEEYWSLTARLTPRQPEPEFPFSARLIQRDGVKHELKDQSGADEALRELEGAVYRVAEVKKRQRTRKPQAPFTTSTLQQEASRKLRFGNRRTMQIAQQLYEGIDLGEAGSVGLITYMRSDSVRVASEAQTEARQVIGSRYGDNYLPKSPPAYKTKGASQDAHEAVRPTSVARTPEEVRAHLTPDQRKLYTLIWERFIASQMAPAILSVTTADIGASRYTFRASGTVVVFDGFMRVYTEGRDVETPLKADPSVTADEEDSAPLPSLAAGQELDLLELLPKQHFTEPPPRYTEATLVKELDEKGIGRPSTWAGFIATILDRGYAALEERKFLPTELGFTVNDLLVAHFPEIMDLAFTSAMETRLDKIEEGTESKIDILTSFWSSFQESLEKAQNRIHGAKEPPTVTDHQCPTCGSAMLLRQSRKGPFLGCSGFPRCRTMLNADGTPIESANGAAVTDQACPKCGKPLVEREGKFGKFLGCSGYPKCRTIVQLPGDEGASPQTTTQESVGVACPKDGGDIKVRRTRKGAVFYGCANYPACDFTTWNRPIGRPCPKCGWPLGEQAFRGRLTGVIKCANPDCDFSERAAPVPPAAAEG